MKLLWLINLPLPEASALMHKETIPFGGWLFAAAQAITEGTDIELNIAFPDSSTTEISYWKGEKIHYYSFAPVGMDDAHNSNVIKMFRDLIQRVQADVVHVFGTEFSHTLAMVLACEMEKMKVVINIQGLVSVCAKHYMAGLPVKVQMDSTFRDIVKRDNLRQQQQRFVERGKVEIEALRRVQHVIGRTEWDKACVKQINPNVNYHFCNETLRDEFYNYQWDLAACERYSIFISQATYPIKGLHFMLEALPLILQRFPQARLCIAGPDIVTGKTIVGRLKMNAYTQYVKRLIEKNNLHKYIRFTGFLDEKQMCSCYLNSHVFVSASSIENSPNSLGEAMLLGVPCVASNVGGVSTILLHNQDGFLYSFDEYYMLAHYVCEIFSRNNLAKRFSTNARMHAQCTHDREKNKKRLLDVYSSIQSS